MPSCCLGPAKLGHDFKDQKRPTHALVPLPCPPGCLSLAALDSGALPGTGAALSLVGPSPGLLSLADLIGQQKLDPCIMPGLVTMGPLNYRDTFSSKQIYFKSVRYSD